MGCVEKKNTLSVVTSDKRRLEMQTCKMVRLQRVMKNECN